MVELISSMLKSQVHFTLREDIHRNTKSKIIKYILWKYRFWFILEYLDRVCILENIQRIFFLTFWYLHFSVFNNEACTSCTFKVQMQTTFCCWLLFYKVKPYFMNEAPRINTSQDFLEKIKDLTWIGMVEGWFISDICIMTSI